MRITGFAFAPTHPGDWAPEQLLLCDCIVQIKAAAVKDLYGFITYEIVGANLKSAGFFHANPCFSTAFIGELYKSSDQVDCQ